MKVKQKLLNDTKVELMIYLLDFCDLMSRQFDTMSR